MSDFVTTAVPPMIPGDIEARNVTVNKRAQNVKVFQVPTVAATADLPNPLTLAKGSLFLDLQTNQLKFVNTVNGWTTVSNA
jgi:hypothetical protein